MLPLDPAAAGNAGPQLRSALGCASAGTKSEWPLNAGKEPPPREPPGRQLRGDVNHDPLLHGTGHQKEAHSEINVDPIRFRSKTLSPCLWTVALLGGGWREGHGLPSPMTSHRGGPFLVRVGLRVQASCIQSSQARGEAGYWDLRSRGHRKGDRLLRTGAVAKARASGARAH